MSLALSRCLCGALTRRTAAASVLSGGHRQAVSVTPWFASVMTLKTSAPLRAEPKKKKKVDPKREQLVRERLKKKLKKMEKIAPEYIPIEDFVTPAKCKDDTRERSAPRLSFEEIEGRALLLKEWSHFKREQHLAEVQAVKNAMEAQREAMEELKLESEELYQAALKPDPNLFPFSHSGPTYTPPNKKYEAPDGEYKDVTSVYTQ